MGTVDRKRSTGRSVLLHLALVTTSAIAVAPVLWILLSSLKPANRILSSEIKLFDQPTLDNYRNVLSNTDFTTWFLNSVVVAAFTMVLGIFMSATAGCRTSGASAMTGVFISATTGYALSRFNFPGRRQLMLVFLVTQMFPVAILIVPIYGIMSNLGLINTLTSLVIAYCTVAVPFCTWMLKGYFDTIPRELDEAAALDGLGPFSTFWRVIIPLARPGLAVTMFYTFLTAWGEVAYATAFLQTDLGYGLQTFVPQFNKQWEDLTPAAILITIPAAMVFMLAQRHLVGGLAAGATKG